jgi:hypothetical protein
MKYTTLILSLFIGLGAIKAQEVDTFYLHIPISQNDTIIYKRIIQCDKHEHLYHVKDYFENAQIHMDAFYSSFDKQIKEDIQCNYHSNTKEGLYQEWFDSGQIQYGVLVNSCVNSFFKQRSFRLIVSSV